MKSKLKNDMEDALEADDFLEFIDLLNPVIEFHNLKKFDNFDFTKVTKDKISSNAQSESMIPEISGGDMLF